MDPTESRAQIYDALDTMQLDAKRIMQLHDFLHYSNKEHALLVNVAASLSRFRQEVEEYLQEQASFHDPAHDFDCSALIEALGAEYA